MTCVRVSPGTCALPPIPKPQKTKLSTMNYFNNFIAKSFLRKEKTKESQREIKEKKENIRKIKGKEHSSWIFFSSYLVVITWTFNGERRIGLYLFGEGGAR